MKTKYIRQAIACAALLLSTTCWANAGDFKINSWSDFTVKGCAMLGFDLGKNANKEEVIEIGVEAAIAAAEGKDLCCIKVTITNKSGAKSKIKASDFKLSFVDGGQAFSMSFFAKKNERNKLMKGRALDLESGQSFKMMVYGYIPIEMAEKLQAGKGWLSIRQ